MMFFRAPNSTLAALSLLCVLTAGQTGQLVSVSNWGSNPTNIHMYIYVPAKLASNPPVILALHECGGNGPAYAQQANYNALADQYGFITIFPSTTNDNNCWDVASSKSLTHNGGGDSEGLANMITYTKTKYNADPSRIFVTGSSSGAMMTNVMCAVYPDIFAAGSAYSGVAAGCLAGSPGASPTTANPACANGQIIKTQAQWVSQVRAMYSSWTGAYPRMQVWHGTADYVVYYPNLGQEILEWSGLDGVTFTKNSTNTPQSGYTKMIYGDGTKFVAYSAVGVGHTVPVHVSVDMSWFGIPGSVSSSTTTTTTRATTMGLTTMATSITTTMKASTSTTTPPSSGTVAHWGQCSGQGWTGGTICASPYTCQYSNAWYSQCL